MGTLLELFFSYAVGVNLDVNGHTYLDPRTIALKLSMRPFSRRHFLFGAGAISLLTTAYGVLPQIGAYPDSKLQLDTLSHKEAAIYRVIGEWLLPNGGPLPGHGGDDVTVLGIDRLLKDLPPGKRDLLRALPLVFEHGTALNRFGSERLTYLSSKDKEDYLNTWTTSTFLVQAQLLAAVKAIYGFAYFEREDVLKATGLPPFCIVT